jgi:recombination protein RecT
MSELSPVVKKFQSPAAKAQIERSLPNGLDSERFMMMVLSAFNQNKNLLKCDPDSVFGGVVQAAQLGLEINTTLGECYLIPYKNRAELQIGYQGALKLIWNSNLIRSLDTGKIYDGEGWDYTKGAELTFYHKPDVLADRSNDEPIIYYAVAYTKEGACVPYLMSRVSVEQHRDRYSQSYRNNPAKSPWTDEFDAMALKTCLLGMARLLPKTSEAQLMRMAASVDNRQLTADDDGNIEDVTYTLSVDEDQPHNPPAVEVNRKATEAAGKPLGPAEHSKYYKEGQQAYADGLPIPDCPHTGEAANCWRDGWREREMEAKQ